MSATAVGTPLARTRPPPHWLRSGSLTACLAAPLLVLAFTALLAPLTPRIAFNDGLGYLDGQNYAAMVRVLRGELDVDIAAPYAYRIAPIALVAWSDMEPVAGLLFLNLVALILSGPLVVLLLRRYGVPPALSLVGLAWLCALGPGLRFALHYPTLLDGAGQLAALALMTSAAYGRFALFSAILPLALLTRENTLLLVPFLWLANLRGGVVRSGVATLLASAAGFVALVAFRLDPPIAPTNAAGVLLDMKQNVAWFAANADERAWRYLAAPALTLGVLLAVPLARRADTARWLRRSPEWAWYVSATLLLALVGGGDYDRFAYWLAPAFLVASFVTLAARGARAQLWLGLSALHLLATRFAEPLGADEASYRNALVALMPISALAGPLWQALLANVAAVCLCATVRRR